MEARSTIIAQWTCEVPPEKREALLRFVISEMRPIYLAKGCIRHELYVALASEKKYFPFHRDLDPNVYVEELAFTDVKAFEESVAAIDADPVSKAAAERYGAEFGVFNCQFTLLAEEQRMPPAP